MTKKTPASLTPFRFIYVRVRTIKIVICTLKGFIVTGGASKLLKYFINNHGSSIITYADRTYSNGDLYEKIGFTLLKTNPPSYRYMKNSITYNRLHFQKHKLKDKLNLFNPELTEYQNMINNGYDRI
jgi:hypothetical protein